MILEKMTKRKKMHKQINKNSKESNKDEKIEVDYQNYECYEAIAQSHEEEDNQKMEEVGVIRQKNRKRPIKMPF